ncbi:transposase [Maledivibacter halophilus]|uniref:REP element-mobilizing transposase RayT n=1 Tax=Maledivibacter halophilus TaxID=36842 RepID=A0A1T5K1D0_9FIRM|nr:transposase [Maledivibacter halophilus]SKC57350.1 REP element-mobilizing transposase RayT [Maledivibacter halophilus]
MGKKKRIWYPGAVYHIMNRGNRRSAIFKDNEDYQVYLTILKETMEKYEYILYAYCLMTNHIHMQIETKNVEIWKIMRYINLSYTKYFNNKYNFIGHLFQGRYRAGIIESDAYNLQTSRYIHLNPVKASMVEKPVEYKWSSYGVYMGEIKNDIVIDEKILSYFRNKSRKLYKEYVESKLMDQQINREIEERMGV